MAIKINELEKAQQDLGVSIGNVLALIDQLKAGQEDPAVLARVDAVTAALVQDKTNLDAKITA